MNEAEESDLSVSKLIRTLNIVASNRKKNQSISEAHAEFLKWKVESHTAQILDRMKEELIKKKDWAEDENNVGNSTWNDGYTTGIRNAIKLIEEVSDE